MKNIPQAIFIIDPRKERNAILEARKLSIPVFGIVDTNCDPDDVDYIIPANDDALRSVKLIVSKMADAIIEANGGVSLDQEVAEEEEKVIDSEEEEKEIVEKPQPRVEKKAKVAQPVVEKEVKVDVKETKVEVKETKVNVVVEEPKLDLESMTVTDLKKLAKERGLKGYSTLVKADLIEALK